jgi:hypothetical protein
MSRQSRYTITLMVAIGAASCAKSPPRPTAPEDPFLVVGAAPLPVSALAGGSALLLPVGVFVLGDSASTNSDLVSRQDSLTSLAATAIDGALRRGARGVRWFGLAEQRRALRMAPALGVEPERIETGALLGPKVQSMVDPLWSELRTLMGLTGARIAVAPAGVKIDRQGGAFTAVYVLVIVDARTGQVAWRGRTDGAAAASPEAALLSAAAAMLPATVPR